MNVPRTHAYRENIEHNENLGHSVCRTFRGANKYQSPRYLNRTVLYKETSYLSPPTFHLIKSLSALSSLAFRSYQVEYILLSS